MEKAINFKIDEKLYTKMKVQLAKEGKSIKGYLIELIKRDLEKKAK